MTCPFRRASSQHQFANGGAGGKKAEFRSRQSSVHLPGPEEEETEKNTLSLKNLNEALQLLTAPSVSSNFNSNSIFVYLLTDIILQFYTVSGTE